LLFDEIILVVINDFIVVVELANGDDLTVDLVDVELKTVIGLEFLGLIFISEQPNK
jgi:hypothetical protein